MRAVCLVLGLVGAVVVGRAAAAEPPPQPAPVADQVPPSAVRLDVSAALQRLARYLTPADLAELTRFLWAAAWDALLGTQNASLPPDLAFKLAVLESRVKIEGESLMQQALQDIERDLRRFVHERLPPLPTLLQPPQWPRLPQLWPWPPVSKIEAP
ncbi:MAG: hypothetical protein NZ524_08935 [Thiobacillaceae bacterium]|nr:hypothetical protein [Thiobacillaceae bacterium]